jgi:hypothetical protein
MLKLQLISNSRLQANLYYESHSRISAGANSELEQEEMRHADKAEASSSVLPESSSTTA